MKTNDKHNWEKYRYFYTWYGLKGYKAMTIKLFRYWLGLDHGQTLDVEKAKNYLINKKN